MTDLPSLRARADLASEVARMARQATNDANECDRLRNRAEAAERRMADIANQLHVPDAHEWDAVAVSIEAEIKTLINRVRDAERRLAEASKPGLAVVEEAVRAVVSTRLIAASITADEMERAPCGVCGSFAPRFKAWIDDFDAAFRAALENPK